MSTVALIGLDLAKSVFQVHGVDVEGKTVLRKRLSRGQMAEFFARLEPCMVAMEACSGSHYWVHQLQFLASGKRFGLVGKRAGGDENTDGRSFARDHT